MLLELARGAAGGEPDEGIWEVRGPRRHFTHSKVMAWVAFDRARAAASRSSDAARAGRALAARCATRSTPRCCDAGLDAERNTFTQSYGSDDLDASLLLMPMVGFLPADDPRVVGTVAADRARADGRRLRAALRPRTDEGVDGLPAGEGVFLACSFWLVDVLALQGRARRGARAVRTAARPPQRRRPAVRGVRPATGRQLGNFPQAFSHLALVGAALAIGGGRR